MDRKPRFDRVPDIEQYFGNGDEVKVRNSDDNTVTATLVQISDTFTVELPADWTDEVDTLYDFWSDHEEVDKHDRVIRVEIGETEYAYPSSRVMVAPLTSLSGVGEVTARHFHSAGYESQIDLAHATEEELLDVEPVAGHTVEQIKAQLGYVDPNGENTVQNDADGDESNVCPVDGCYHRIEDETLYDHMIAEHGWYMESLEVA